jgi:hypothetical protein
MIVWIPAVERPISTLAIHIHLATPETGIRCGLLSAGDERQAGIPRRLVDQLATEHAVAHIPNRSRAMMALQYAGYIEILNHNGHHG